MRILSWFLSILLHAAVIGLAVWAAQSAPRMIDLGVPVYQVDLVNLAQAPPGPAAKAAPRGAPRPAPKPRAVPVPAPPKPAPEPEVKPEPVAKPEPKPEAKEVAAKEKEPEKKAEPVKKPEPEKKPKPEKKPGPSREEILKQALERAQRDVKWKERQERKAVEKELEAVRRSVAEADAEAEAAGGGGNATVAVAGGLADIYAARVVAAIRPNWRFPSLPGVEDLAAKVRIRIAPDGTIREYAVVRTSGRPEFDASVLKAVEETRELPQPPRPDLEYIVVNFNLSELK